MKKRKHIDQSGLTLLEVLISMIILGISLLLLLNMAMVALDGNDWSRRMTTATQLMQEKLEQLRASDSPTSGSDTSMGVSRSWIVTSAGTHLRQVKVTATWENIKSAIVTDSLLALIKTDSV